MKMQKIYGMLLLFCACIASQQFSLYAMEIDIEEKQLTKKQKLEEEHEEEKIATQIARQVPSLQDLALKTVTTHIEPIQIPEILTSTGYSPKLLIQFLLTGSSKIGQKEPKHLLQLSPEALKQLNSALPFYIKTDPLDAASTIISKPVLHTQTILQQIRDQLLKSEGALEFKKDLATQLAKNASKDEKKEDIIDPATFTDDIEKTTKAIAALTTIADQKTKEEKLAVAMDLYKFHDYFADDEYAKHQKMLLAVASPTIPEQASLQTEEDPAERVSEEYTLEDRKEAKELFAKLPAQLQATHFHLALKQFIGNREREPISVLNTQRNMAAYQALYDQLMKENKDFATLLGYELVHLYEDNNITDPTFNTNNPLFDPNAQMPDELSELWTFWM